jgi:hypothetical protein
MVEEYVVVKGVVWGTTNTREKQSTYVTLRSDDVCWSLAGVQKMKTLRNRIFYISLFNSDVAQIVPPQLELRSTTGSMS